MWQPVDMVNHLEAWRKARGLSQEKLAQRIRPPTDKTQISKLEKGDRRLTDEWLTRIARALHCEARDLLGPPGASTATAIEGDEVPEIDAQVGAGGGGHMMRERTKRAGHRNETISDDPVLGSWRFPTGYLTRELRAKPSASRVIEVHGDSMAPTLLSGDRVLVDTSQQSPSPPGLFALWDGLGIVAKRLEYIPNTDPPQIKIISDNTRHEPYTRTAEEVQVIGRILWFARRL
jgi:transcriptional regulator with XRE-family HTH domain